MSKLFTLWIIATLVSCFVLMENMEKTDGDYYKIKRDSGIDLKFGRLGHKLDVALNPENYVSIEINETTPIIIQWTITAEGAWGRIYVVGKFNQTIYPSEEIQYGVVSIPNPYYSTRDTRLDDLLPLIGGG